MSLEAVKQYFKEQDMESRVMEFQQSSATVEEAAAAIRCEPRQIAKTMSFYVDDAPILIVLAGDTKIDNKKYKAKFQQKAKMIPGLRWKPLPVTNRVVFVLSLQDKDSRYILMYL